MPTPSPQYAFVAGEISRRLFGRSDIERYFLGAASCLNFWVDYRGGLTYRPGTAFGDWIDESQGPAKLVPFSFSINNADSYVIVFGHQYIRFIQSGGYVLEDPFTISSVTTATPAVFTTTAPHGYSNGDWVFLQGGGINYASRTFSIQVLSTTTFELYDVDGTPIDGSVLGLITTPLTVSRVYTLTSPYVSGDIPTLHEDQDLNVLVLSHVNYQTRTLTRNDATDWTLATVSFEPTITTPPAPTVTGSGVGTAGVGFIVTAVNSDGVESRPSLPGFATTIEDYATVSGSAKITGYGVTGTRYYNIYRTLISPNGAFLTAAEEFGFVGRSFGPSFNDANIDADFAVTPPVLFLPFNDGQILEVEVTAGGSGYSTFTTTVTATGGGGSGFSGLAVVDGGVVIHVQILNPGSGYTTAPTLVFGGGGTGATATVTIGPTSGNYPATSIYFQQRRVYAGTTQLPRTLFGSRPGDPYNLAVSIEAQASDGYSYELDSRLLSPIRHLIRSGRGLLVFSATEVWEMRGFDDESITALGASVEEQVFLGATLLRPIKINTTVLYAAERGTSIQGLKYNQTLRAFQSEDLSILANHLFAPETQIEEWGYIGEPSKIVLGKVSNGLVYAFTYADTENVKGWARAETQGLFTSLTVVKEGQTDTAYVITQRTIGGKNRTIFEKWQPQEIIEEAEDGWFLDCAIELPQTKPAANLTASGVSGTITLTASASVFTSADVGKVFRGGGGRGIVASFISGTQITITLRKNITETIPQINPVIPRLIVSQEWTLDPQVTVIGGLWAYEGHQVRPFVDGQVQPLRTVSNGQITLQTPGSKVLIGLGYRGIIQTLPAEIENVNLAHRRVKITEATTRLDRTSGLQIGPSLDALEYMRDRTHENYNEPTNLRSGVASHIINGEMEIGPSMFIVQDSPLPATILSTTKLLDVGDDEN